MRPSRGPTAAAGAEPPGNSDANGFVEALDPALDVVWSDVVGGTSTVHGLDVVIGPDDRPTVLFDSDGLARIRVYLPEGTLLTESTHEGYVPAALARAPAGGMVVLWQSFEVVTISRWGTYGTKTTHPHPFPLGQGVAAASAPGGFAMVGVVAESAESGSGRLLRVDGFGFSACGAAGACGALEAASCDDGDPCSAAHCDPISGICTHSPVPSGEPCGPGLICQGGFCL